METLKIDDGGDRLSVQLHRPEVRNAIDQQMVDELHEVCADLERNPRVLVLSGTGGVFGCFALAMVAGIALIVLSQAWFLLLVGVGCVAAAWGYTGGRNPYGYLGLGDLFVFVFFGLVATLGTTYTQAGQLSGPAWIGAVSTGIIAMALLMANNVRDIPTDREAGKLTLAVRLGDTAARISYVMMLAVALLLPLFLVYDYPWVLLVLLLIPLCLMPSWLMLKGKKRRSLIPVLKQTSIINLGFSVLFGAGVVLSGVLA